MKRLTGSNADFEGMQKLYLLARRFAETVWDTMLQPLPGRAELARQFAQTELDGEAWRALVEEPLGRALERYVQDDLVRGVVFTDAKIGLLTHPHDESLLQNRCFLYHLMGNRTGEWKVPVGGMGKVADELSRRVLLIFEKDVNGIRPVFGTMKKMQTDEHFRDHLLFYEYFDGESGRGLGASHQTGWTALIATYFTNKKIFRN